MRINAYDREYLENAQKNLGNMLDYAVSDGTGKYADVKGYSIGGKSGTSENLGPL